MERNSYRRINITLPEGTVRLLERVAEKGERSRFVDEALRFYVEARGKAKLRRLIAQGAEKRAERDLVIAEEWFPIENEAWQKGRV